MGGVRPDFGPGPVPALGDPSVCSSAPPSHTLTCTAPASSPLCSAVLGSRSSCCLRGRVSWLWVGAGCAKPYGSLRLVPGVCPGWCLCSRPCLLTLHSQWADPSMGMITGTLHWASRAGGGGLTHPSGRWMGCPPDWPDPVETSAMPETISKPCWRGAVPGQYGCCFCPLELLLPE